MVRLSVVVATSDEGERLASTIGALSHEPFTLCGTR